MKYGSLVNHLLDKVDSPIPQVGMGATELLWSDRHAYTIIDVSKSGRVITLQADIATRIDNNGMSDSQEYKYERDTEGVIVKASKRKNGTWVQVGQSNSPVFAIGYRQEYYDYSF